jgi:[ribosomal protein S5]-alanine N-acetyltransferase
VSKDILTDRLRLRAARMNDLEAMHGIMGNPTAMRYWSSPPHTDIAQTREWVELMIGNLANGREDFVIECDGRVIGKAGCYKAPAVGYILHPDYWGRGLAREAMTAVIDRVFTNLDVDELVADVDPRNVGSLVLLDRLGFKEVGRAERTWLVGEEWCDSVYLSMSRPGRG